ncbi:MAG: ROK family protein [Athalassotoga sp.]|uniref:ROK family protein n=1 Tax=Athalassotoga sp. TaxID=2022597 RepID=UPI003D00807F
MNSIDKYLVGLDIGGTKTAIVVGNEKFEIIKRYEFPTKPKLGFSDFFARLLNYLSEIDSIGAIGVSVGGPLDAEKGIIYNPPHLGWGTVYLLDEMKKHFECPVKIEHDAKAGAIAEFELGAGRGFRNIIFLTLGTGLGAGIIINGEIYRGSSNMAGEVGHIRIAEDGPEVYGKSGSWESYCSGDGIAKLARYLFPDHFSRRTTAQDISKMALSGDEKSAEVLKKSGRYLGIGLANLFDIFDPDRIILGSLSLRLPDIWLEEAKNTLVKEALDAQAVNKVVKSMLGERIGDYAALITAFKALKEARNGT